MTYKYICKELRIIDKERKEKYTQKAKLFNWYIETYQADAKRMKTQIKEYKKHIAELESKLPKVLADIADLEERMPKQPKPLAKAWEKAWGDAMASLTAEDRFYVDIDPSTPTRILNDGSEVEKYKHP